MASPRTISSSAGVAGATTVSRCPAGGRSVVEHRREVAEERLDLVRRDALALEGRDVDDVEQLVRDLEEEARRRARDLAAAGLLAEDARRLRVTEDGRRLLDAVLERLLAP